MKREPIQGGSPQALQLARRITIGLAAGAVLLCALAGWASGEPAIGWGMLVLIAVSTLIAVASNHQTRTRRQRSFVRDLGGSLDRARDALDVDLVRSLQAERGDAVAAREIQRQLPELSLKQIGQLLHSL